LPQTLAISGDISLPCLRLPLPPDGFFNDFRANLWHELYIAKQQTTVIGTFSLFVVQRLSHNGGRSLIVEDVVVKAEFQGKGIGRQMMELAIERGQTLGCYKIILSSGAVS
jgi:GNAT superfamily N-acetyltransferase